MAMGQNAAKNGHNREYWSRRPGARWAGWGRPFKIITHRCERRAAAREEHLAITGQEDRTRTIDE